MRRGITELDIVFQNNRVTLRTQSNLAPQMHVACGGRPYPPGVSSASAPFAANGRVQRSRIERFGIDRIEALKGKSEPLHLRRHCRQPVGPALEIYQEYPHIFSWEMTRRTISCRSPMRKPSNSSKGQRRVTGGRKTVAFLSCAPHQTRLFAFFRGGMPSDVRTTLANTNFLPLMPAFWLSLLKVLFGARVPDAITDPVIALDYRKYVVNRAALLRPLDAMVKWLWRKVAAAYVVLFRNRLRAQHADLLVVWGGFQLPIASALAVAREAGIKTLFCENGYLPKTIVMDPDGINAGNSLMGKPPEFYRAVAMSQNAGEDLFSTPLVTRPLKRGSTASENITLPTQFVFLPLQVHDDSQILLYSPHFPDMPSVIRFCVAGVAARNKRHGTQLALVVKEHPSDHGRIDYSDMRRAFQTSFSLSWQAPRNSSRNVPQSSP